MSAIPNAWILNQVKTIADDFLTDTCLIMRKQHVKLAGAARRETLVIVATGAPCRMVRIGARYDTNVDTVQGQQVLGDSFRISVKPTQTIDVDYVFELDSVEWHVVRLEVTQTQKVWNTAVVGRLRRG